jgi:uncharacterized membrane protein YbhN (UPF0104 family)
VRRPRHPLRLALRLGVSLAIAVYILTDVDWADLGAAIIGVDLRWVALAATVYLGGQVLSGVKWSMFGRAVGFDRPIGTYVRFYYFGMFFNLVGPSTIGGDLARGLYLSDGARRTVALNSVMFDRMTGLVVLMALAAVSLLVAGQDLPWALRMMVIVGGTGIVAGWWLCPRLVRVLPEGHRIRLLVENDLATYWSDRGMLLRVCTTSLLFHFAQVGQQWTLARAVGADLSLSYCFVIHPLLSVMMALPVSIAGFGVREGGYLYFLTRIDIDDSIAVTMGLLWWAVTVVGGVVGGLVFLQSGARMPRIRARTAERVEPTHPVRGGLPRA